MFYNISNHPSARWSNSQKTATASDVIVDVPFPNIPPKSTLKEVENMVAQVSVQIAPESGVLVAGEPTFCAALVKELQLKNCKCWVACSERNTITNNDDGTKTVCFQFVQFREWPKLG